MGKLSPMLAVVFGIVGIFICLIIFPLVMTGVHTIISDPNITDYTGLSQVASVAPLLIFLALLTGSGWLMVSGIKKGKASRKSKRAR